MTTFNFETVTTPSGAFIGWATQPGQVITGKVLSYGDADGQDFAGAACPQVVLELIEPGVSVNKDGDRTDFNAGEIVTITAGQANLKRGMRAAQPSVGDVLRVTHTSNEKTQNGVVKIFEIQIARGAASSVKPAQQATNNGIGANPFAQPNTSAAAPF